MNTLMMAMVLELADFFWITLFCGH